MARRLPQPAPKRRRARPKHARDHRAASARVASAHAEPKPLARPRSDGAIVQRLERELHKARAELQETVEELEAANEELRASNEELTSTNERLQTSNEALRTSQEELRDVNDEIVAVNARLAQQAQLVHLSHDAIMIRRFDGTIEAWNRGAEQLYGFTAQEAIGQRTHDILGTVFPKPLAEVEEDLRRTGTWAGELRHRTKAGTWLTVLANLQLGYDEHGVARILEANRDFTDRKRAEEELRLSEEKFARAFHGNTAAMALTRLRDGAFIDVNARWEELTGYRREEAVGRSSSDLRVWSRPEDRDTFVRMLQQDGKIDAEEFAFRRRGGVEWVGLVSSQVTSLGGEPAVVSSILDVSERRRAEEELRRSERALREADRRRTEFLAVLSHELRNPLAPIKNSLYVLERAAPEGDQAGRARVILNRQVDQLARLVDDLLDVTRVTRGKVQLQRRQVEVNELVRRAVEDHRLLLEQHGVACRVEGTPEPVLVEADPNRLDQVIGNLLSNAAKFTLRGGHVSVSVARDAVAGQALIQVADDGVGMAPEMVARLFEPFTQADATLDRSSGGLGLGLALVKGLVELHGGSVSGASEGLGKGATFTIQLPLDASGRRVEPPSPGDEPLAPLRVLVIEDNVDAAESLRDVLRLGQHLVEVAYDGARGTALARTFEPDLVLCDIGLPGMDGYEVARVFRSDPALREIQLIALTGYAQPEDVARAREAGFDAHLAKPPSLDRLQDLLRQRGRSLRRA